MSVLSTLMSLHYKTVVRLMNDLFHNKLELWNDGFVKKNNNNIPWCRCREHRLCVRQTRLCTTWSCPCPFRPAPTGRTSGTLRWSRHGSRLRVTHSRRWKCCEPRRYRTRLPAVVLFVFRLPSWQPLLLMALLARALSQNCLDQRTRSLSDTSLKNRRRPRKIQLDILLDILKFRSLQSCNSVF